MQKEPLEAGTPSENPHLNKLYDLAKETETQHLDHDMEAAASRRVSEAWKRSASLRVYNLPKDLREEDLLELFAPYGEVSYIKIGMCH